MPVCGIFSLFFMKKSQSAFFTFIYEKLLILKKSGLVKQVDQMVISVSLDTKFLLFKFCHIPFIKIIDDGLGIRQVFGSLDMTFSRLFQTFFDADLRILDSGSLGRVFGSVEKFN
ncbi:hypothetical protein RhiirC2_707215 [Rhizophagus irregularis]|uniref:Uncharacterized protein n=1 Tax=Rhizophagus irregularis TaxID=588596 RepID=A0A2N1NS08_9GLOM|nr:hypothetical protein RhiirC2_707215 [Rhizophagus irregularis]